MRKYRPWTWMAAVVIGLSALASAAVAEESAEDILKQLAERRARIRTLHHTTKTTTIGEKTTETVTVELWEKRDGDTVMQRVARESIEVAKETGKPVAPASRAVTVTDGKHTWQEIKVGDKVLVVKGRAAVADEFKDLRTELKEGRGRTGESGDVGGQKCIVVEVVGGQESERSKTSYWLHESYGVLLKQTTASAGGPRTELTTVELKINEPIDESHFIYTAPEGAMVVDTETMKPPPSD